MRKNSKAKKEMKVKNEKLILEVYKDIAQPIAKQAGVALGEVGKLIFSPIYYPTKYLNDRIEKWFDRIENNVPKENRVEAMPNITIPTFQNLALHDDDTLLGEMFFNTLQSSVDKTKQKNLNPAFPKILEQISQEEAKILTLLKMHEYIKFSCYSRSKKEKPQVYKETIDEINNKNIDKEFFLMHKNHLMLLGLVTHSFEQQAKTYFEIDGKLVNHKSLEAQEIFKQNKSSNYQIIIHNFYSLELNDFGKAFAEICISEKCKEFIN